MKIRDIDEKITNPVLVDVVNRSVSPADVIKGENGYIFSTDKRAFALFLPTGECLPVVGLDQTHTLSVGKSKGIQLSLIGAEKAKVRIKAPGLILNDDTSTLKGAAKWVTVPGTLKITVPEGGNWGMYRVLTLLGKESQPKVYSRSKAFAIPDFKKPDKDISPWLRPRDEKDTIKKGTKRDPSMVPKP